MPPIEDEQARERTRNIEFDGSARGGGSLGVVFGDGGEHRGQDVDRILVVETIYARRLVVSASKRDPGGDVAV